MDHSKKFLRNFEIARSKNYLDFSKNKLLLLTGFLTEQCLLRKHMKRMSSSETDECRFCGEEEEIPVHLITECLAIASLRMEYLGQGHYRRNENLAYLKPSQILEFIRALELEGRSHDKSSHLFRLGQKSSQGVKAFAETGRSDLLEVQNQGQKGVFDDFNAPSIAQGVGRTEAKFFVDGNHSLVSLMSRIIPSPDWFIGIDSFDLCINGNWLDSITIEVDPIDAGTDNGFTFTAPNWATEPQGEAYRITAHYPAHPAGSFFYPYLRKLPTIATFQFIKLKEYELNEVFHHAEDDRKYDVVEEMVQDNTINVFDGNKDFQMAISEEREEQENHINYRPLDRVKPYETLTSTLSSTRSWTNDRTHNLIDPGKPVTPSSASGSNVVSLGNKDAILNGIAQFYTNPKKNDKPRHKKNRRTKKYYKKYRPPRDCRVSDWSEWSSCSKSCGIGEMTRRREVKKHAKRGGRLCPPLVETKWCGSARSCNKQYFDW